MENKPFKIIYEWELPDSFENTRKNELILSIVNDFEDGERRYKKFNTYIFDSIIETALSFEEREKLINQPSSLSERSIINLRNLESYDKGKWSEIAEILLYWIMKDYYYALSVVPKIFYKQNKQDPVKGADSVHIVVKWEDFELWLWEAKFYQDINSAINSAIDSVYSWLQTDKLKRENLIITWLKELDWLEKKWIIDSNFKQKIKHELDWNTSIDVVKPKLHIPILILYECPLTKNTSEINSEYEKEIKNFHLEKANKFFKQNYEKIQSIHWYEKITFHIIILPIPDKETVVKNFDKRIEAFN